MPSSKWANPLCFGQAALADIVQAAALVSAAPIIAVDRFDSCEARSADGSPRINSSTNDPEQAIKDALGRQALDVFVDNTGVPAIIELGYNLTDRHGRVVLVGVPRRGNTVNLYSLPLHFGKQLTGSQSGEAVPQRHPRYLRLQTRETGGTTRKCPLQTR